MGEAAWFIRRVAASMFIVATGFGILGYVFGPSHVDSYCDHGARVYVTTQWGHDTHVNIVDYDPSCGPFPDGG